MSEAANIILYHQEHYDGSGYPKGARLDQIPIGARIFMVIDALDSITSDRPYRKANSFDFAKAEIQRMKVVSLILRLWILLSKKRKSYVEWSILNVITLLTLINT